jgi:hypothetical protein
MFAMRCRRRRDFSERNIKRMLALYREYASVEFVPQAVAQMISGKNIPPILPKKNVIGV